MNQKIRNDQARDLVRQSFHYLAHTLMHWSDQCFIPLQISTESAEREKEKLYAQYHSSCTVTRVSSIGVLKGGPS